MPDRDLERLADVVVRYCARVRIDDLVTIVGEPSSESAVESLFEAILRAGGHPSFHVKSERLQEVLLREGSDAQIQHVSPFERHRLETCDVLIVLRAPRNTRFLEEMDPRKVALWQSARGELMAMSMGRAAEGKMRYVLTEIPTEAAARDAGMSFKEYQEWVYRAGFLDLPDPVAAWKELSDSQERMIEFLSRKRILRFQSPPSRGGESWKHEGTDLTVDVSDRIWVNCAGGENFPDGEVFTGPRSAEGVVNFTFPAVHTGREFEGIRLQFREGRVVEASATRNEEALIALLDQDEGARFIGEIALGTNYRLEFTKNTFFDEKIGGTFHLALGAGYPETGNDNRSGLHWDLVSDLRAEGTVHADGELIQRDGRFLMDGWPSAAP